MRLSVLMPLAAAFALTACPALAQHRELGAHEHGRGALDIAVEGNKVSMEFRAPGMDIVGFEQEAKTRAQKAAVDKAKKQLAEPMKLFALPAAAGCVVEDAKVAVATDEDHDHDKSKAPAQAGAPGKEQAASREDHDHDHGEFRATYALNCKSPASITSIEFGYFRAFAGSRKLDVNLITGKGQTSFQVTRAKPRIDLAGQI